MIQWCDGPMPSVNRPEHATWVVIACCAMMSGWRVLMRYDRGSDFDALGDLSEKRDRRHRVQVAGHLRDPERRETVTLGGLSVVE